MERCPSGRWYLPRKQANGLFRSVGSNPTLSASTDVRYEISDVRILVRRFAWLFNDKWEVMRIFFYLLNFEQLSFMGFRIIHLLIQALFNKGTALKHALRNSDLKRSNLSWQKTSNYNRLVLVVNIACWGTYCIDIC